MPLQAAGSVSVTSRLRARSPTLRRKASVRVRVFKAEIHGPDDGEFNEMGAVLSVNFLGDEPTTFSKGHPRPLYCSALCAPICKLQRVLNQVSWRPWRDLEPFTFFPR